MLRVLRLLTGLASLWLLALSGTAQAGIAGVNCPLGGIAATLRECTGYPQPGQQYSQGGIAAKFFDALFSSGAGDEVRSNAAQYQDLAIFRMSRTRDQPDSATRQAAVDATTGAAAAGGGSRWNVWLANAQSRMGSQFQPQQSNGTAAVTAGGFDYTFAGNAVVLGMAITDEKLRVDTSFNGGKISGDGASYAPYVAWRIGSNWMLDASTGWGKTNVNIVSNANGVNSTGSTQVKRSFTTAGLAYNLPLRQWLLTGKGSLTTNESRFASMTVSAPAFGAIPTVDGFTTRTTQARLMAQAAYNAGSVIPYASVTYVYDVQRSALNPVAGQTPANDRDGWLLAAGLNFQSQGALYGGVRVSSEVGRSQVKNDSIMLNVGVRF